MMFTIYLYLCGRLAKKRNVEIGLEMKRQLTRVVLIGSMIVQNLCAVASDYSGRHYTDDSSDSSSGLGFLIMVSSDLSLLSPKGANKRREFIDASFVFDTVIRSNLYNKARWIESDLLANLDATHGEFEAGTFYFSLLWFLVFAFHYRLVIFV